MKAPTRPSLKNINTNFPTISLWASQEISCYGQLCYVTNWQMQCAVCFWFNYLPDLLQKMRLRNPQTCGSCTAAHQIIYSELSTHILWRADGRGGPVNWPARSSENNALGFWLLQYIKTLLNSCSAFIIDCRRSGSSRKTRNVWKVRARVFRSCYIVTWSEWFWRSARKFYVCVCVGGGHTGVL
jgi:hypothetical protein